MKRISQREARRMKRELEAWRAFVTRLHSDYPADGLPFRTIELSDQSRAVITAVRLLGNLVIGTMQQGQLRLYAVHPSARPRGGPS